MRHLLNSTAILLVVAFAGTTASAQTQQQAPETQQQQESQQQPGAEQQTQQQDTTQQRQAQQQAAAGQECQVVRQDFEQQVMQDPEMRAGFSSAIMRDLRAMRDTALRLEQYGQSQACDSVAQAMQEILQDPQQYAQMRSQTQQRQMVDTQQQPGATTDTTQQDQQLGWQDRWAQDREQAVAFSELGQVRADELIGADVRGMDDESLGEVDDIIIGADGQSGYLIIAYGGFLGIGQELTAVPLDSLSINPEQDVVYLNMTQADLEQAPTFERGDYTWMQDDEWRQRSDEFYRRG